MTKSLLARKGVRLFSPARYLCHNYLCISLCVYCKGILHPILFFIRDTASRHIVELLEQECTFLSRMKHPNIIQYLGTCCFPETKRSILLMVLMDESLTSFLEPPDDPPSLPFHTQINIFLQALAYLHSNNIQQPPL